MNSVSAANQEEAATIAAEFVSGLDNLPHEVQHLLAEIRHKENRAQELQQDIQKETTRYIRHAAKGSAPRDGKDKDTKDRDALIPAKVASDYAELDILSADKIALAARVVELLTRVNARLDHDLSRVVALSGEHMPPEHIEVRGGYVVSVTPTAGTAGGGVASTGPVAGIATGTRAGTVDKVVDSLRSSVGLADSPGSPLATSSPGSTKRRRITTTNSSATITVPSALSVAHRGHTPQARSRLGQQVHPSPPLRGRRAASSLLGDEDAEGEDEADADADGETEESGDAEDKELYCFCRKMSYGEMIACDNQDCAFQWFHLPCVGVKSPLPEVWYCDDCLKALGVGQGGGTGTERGRKGRRK